MPNITFSGFLLALVYALVSAKDIFCPGPLISQDALSMFHWDQRSIVFTGENWFN
jgi:hypothetical protein